MVFVCNADINWLGNKRHIIINNYKFKIRNLKYILKKYDNAFRNAMLPIDNKFNRNSHRYTYLESQINIPTQHEAMIVLNKQYNILRSLFNFRLSSRKLFHSTGPRSASPIGPSRYIWIFDEKKKYLTYYYHNINERHYREYQPIVNPKQYLIEIMNFIKRFNLLKRQNEIIF